MDTIFRTVIGSAGALLLSAVLTLTFFEGAQTRFMSEDAPIRVAQAGP